MDWHFMYFVSINFTKTKKNLSVSHISFQTSWYDFVQEFIVDYKRFQFTWRKFVLTHRQHILHIHFCSWKNYISRNVWMSPEAWCQMPLVRFVKKILILHNITTKCNIKFINLQHILHIRSWWLIFHFQKCLNVTRGVMSDAIGAVCQKKILILNNITTKCNIKFINLQHILHIRSCGWWLIFHVRCHWCGLSKKY